jgi:hypothetical protein
MHVTINGEETGLAGLAKWVSQLVDECARCGERISKRDEAAEAADGLVHADCMRPGEEVA